ncbi:sulfotransferase family 2 domain-containing protein [uncultured Sulfitobacter sp.]|uniref:sulfotransferase family 2 domain-containing protein n=1 Tax=Sulfitobacter sp. SH22 TaxID=3421172 RepID=UPI0025EC61D1|nr:sulfotransferase family 2 domain-containing protein [uncultured Sulfitobacter sp.]
MRKIVFLHIPKTAGQTVHSELSRIVGPGQTSPVRVHTQAEQNGQFPPGYTLYSGHLDWEHLDQVQGDRFVFTILRNPFERIASFYFYLHHKSLALPPATLNEPAHTGLRNIRERTVDDYFFGGAANWQQFILDHYDNFYCTYFATRKIRGASDVAKLHPNDLIEMAQKQADLLDRIYPIEGLTLLEADIARLTGARISVAEKRVNAGPQAEGTKRWPQLLEKIESDANREKLTGFAVKDIELMRRLRHQGVLHG